MTSHKFKEPYWRSRDAFDCTRRALEPTQVILSEADVNGHVARRETHSATTDWYRFLVLWVEEIRQGYFYVSVLGFTPKSVTVPKWIQARYTINHRERKERNSSWKSKALFCQGLAIFIHLGALDDSVELKTL